MHIVIKSFATFLHAAFFVIEEIRAKLVINPLYQNATQYNTDLLQYTTYDSIVKHTQCIMKSKELRSGTSHRNYKHVNTE